MVPLVTESRPSFSANTSHSMCLLRALFTNTLTLVLSFSARLLIASYVHVYTKSCWNRPGGCTIRMMSVMSGFAWFVLAKIWIPIREGFLPSTSYGF